MAQIRDGITQAKGELVKYKHAPRFAPAGQSTQMIIGATPESDKHILTLTQALYDQYKLKRVFFSAYMPVSDSSLLPARQDFKPPLLREHRLYQADWLLRFSSRPCCGSTGCTRPTGCCGSTTSGRRSCWTRPAPTSTPGWTPSVPGLWGIWSSSRWR